MDEIKKKLDKTSELVDVLIIISTELIKEVNELEERLKNVEERLEKNNKSTITTKIEPITVEEDFIRKWCAMYEGGDR